MGFILRLILQMRDQQLRRGKYSEYARGVVGIWVCSVQIFRMLRRQAVGFVSEMQLQKGAVAAASEGGRGGSEPV